MSSSAGNGGDDLGDANTLPLTPAPRSEARRDGDLLSSAGSPTAPPTPSTSGVFNLGGESLPEALARELITRRFAAAGFQLEADYPFRDGDTLVVLDGFDPERRVGFQYLSHADQDVVTDHDVAASAALGKLAAGGDARILVIHDGQASSGDELLALVDEFLG